MADSTTGPGRFIGPVIAAVIFLGGGVALFFYPASPWLWLLTLVALALLAQGLRDLLQQRHTLLRNYPLLAHFRWFLNFCDRFYASTLSRMTARAGPITGTCAR